MKKKVLILYAKIGKGHYSASKSTKDALEKLYNEEIDVEMVDFFRLVSKSIDTTTQKAYNGSVKYLPSMYKAFFEFYDKRWRVKLLNKITYPLLYTALKKLIKEKNPDILVSTFPFWDYTIAQLWKKKKPNAKFINIITDSISIHKAWLIADADIRVVPNELF